MSLARESPNKSRVCENRRYVSTLRLFSAAPATGTLNLTQGDARALLLTL